VTITILSTSITRGGERTMSQRKALYYLVKKEARADPKVNEWEESWPPLGSPKKVQVDISELLGLHREKGLQPESQQHHHDEGVCSAKKLG